VPKAQAKFMTKSGVIVSPTIPLTPDIPIFSSFIESLFAHYSIFLKKATVSFFSLGLTEIN
jgi:hypothetical protein